MVQLLDVFGLLLFLRCRGWAVGAEPLAETILGAHTNLDSRILKAVLLDLKRYSNIEYRI